MLVRAFACFLALLLTACSSGGDSEAPTSSSSSSPASSASETSTSATTAVPERGALHEPVAERATDDREDDVGGPLVHAVYAIPADGEDGGLDLDGSIAGSAAATNEWIADQTGLGIRFDTVGGRLDVTFHVLARTAAEYEAEDVFIRDAIEVDMIAAGFDRPDTIYAVYYAGPSADCASGFSPETLPGSVVGLYWVHVEPGDDVCVPEAMRGPGEGAGIWEYSLAHEVFHGLGAVPSCAPNEDRDGHTGDDNTDLMYAGDLDWLPSVIDVGNDDYFGHGRPDCLDLAGSPYLAPT